MLNYANKENGRQDGIAETIVIPDDRQKARRQLEQKKTQTTMFLFNC